MSPSAVEKESEPADLAGAYGAPFPIYSEDEGSRYISLSSRDFNRPRSLDFGLIQSLGATKSIKKYYRRLGWSKFVKMKHDAYQQLMLEFYTTLSFSSTTNNNNNDDDDEFACRLMGKNVTVTRKTLCDIFGFCETGHTSVPDEFDPVGFWDEITERGSYKPNPANGLIRNPILLIMHKYISHAVFGNFRSTRVSEKDLFYLWCLRRRVGVCTPSFLISTFKSVSRSPWVSLCLGDFITAIAVHFGVFDPDNTDMTVLPMRALGLASLKRAQICVSDVEFKDFRERKCYKVAEEMVVDPNVGPSGTTPPTRLACLLPISSQLEKMRKLMGDIFDAMNARFDRDVEELKRENIEARQTIDELRMKISESDKVAEEYKTRLALLLLPPKTERIEEHPVVIMEGANLEFPDDAENVAVLSSGVRPASNSSGSKSSGLSKEGCNPPQAENNECNEPQSDTECKGDKIMARSSSASEIVNSDDGAAVISFVGKNKMNFVWSPSSSKSSKRNRPACVEDSTFVNSTAKRGKNTCTSDGDIILIHKKENETVPASDSQTPVEKSDDEVSSDDESLSDSRMNDLVASLKSNQLCRKWMCAA